MVSMQRRDAMGFPRAEAVGAEVDSLGVVEGCACGADAAFGGDNVVLAVTSAFTSSAADALRRRPMRLRQSLIRLRQSLPPMFLFRKP